MNLSLRAKLRLPEGCSDAELQDACNRYYSLYTGILESSAPDAVKVIAENKRNDLVNSARQAQITLSNMDEVSFESVPSNTSATVELELSQISNSITPEKANELNKRIATLSHSAKRYYLSALVVLHRRDATVSSYREAAAKLQSAIKEDPENIVYTATLEAIRHTIESHNLALTSWQAEEKARLAKIHRETVAKSIFSGLGTVLLWIGGALLAIIGGLCSCTCELCSECNC